VVQHQAQGWWVIALSFVVALVLSIVPLPPFLQWARPEWVALVLIYWVIALPNRVGVTIGFVVGVLLDVLEGSTLGQNALALVVVAYFSCLLYQRLRMFVLWQQAMMVFILIGVNQLVYQWVHSLGTIGDRTLAFLLPALVSALFWPWIFASLRHYRRQFRVQ
jgi:rod shape-determining protein MreD